MSGIKKKRSKLMEYFATAILLWLSLMSKELKHERTMVNYMKWSLLNKAFEDDLLANSKKKKWTLEQKSKVVVKQIRVNLLKNQLSNWLIILCGVFAFITLINSCLRRISSNYLKAVPSL